LKNDATAFIAALVFSVHPAHVETVTSLVGRAESMSAFFYLLSLYLFIREEERERLVTPLLVLSYLMFFLALLSKESAITLPPIILFTSWFLRIRREPADVAPACSSESAASGDPCHANNDTFKVWKSAFLRTLPYGGIFIFYMIVRLKIVGAPGINPSGWYFKDVTTSARLAAMCVGFLAYLRLLVLPVSMSVDYNFPLRIAGPVWADQPGGFLNFWALSGLIVIMICLFSIHLAVKKKSPFAYPLLFFLITLFPFSNIMPFGDFIAERFLYLPSFGYCLFAGILFIRLRKSHKYGRMILVLTAALLLFYSARTFLRNRDWRSGIHLWKAEAKQNPRNPTLYSGLGAEYMVERKEQLIQGNVFRKKGDFKKSARHLELARDYEKMALAYFETALRENPKDFMACYNYGCLSAEMMEPDIDRAEEILLQGASCMPDNLRSLHVFYYYLGLLNFKRNPPDLERAMMFLEKSHQLKKSNDTVLNFVAAILGKTGRSKEALAVVRKVLARNPVNREMIKILKIIRHEDQNKK
jgi:tetratricopeptide (TPR) repeat protein